MSTYVLVHGAWSGGWFWQRVAAILRHSGHLVFTPTLTGLGDRSHLANAEIDLQLHIQDVVQTFDFEDVRDVILVGHSYAGMVISGAAEKVSHRIQQLVYLDALYPRDGEAVADLLGRVAVARFLEMAPLGPQNWRIPCMFSPESLGILLEEDTAWMADRLVPHPLRTLFEAITLNSAEARRLPRKYIAFTRPSLGIFDLSAERARTDGCAYQELEVGHAAPVTHPRQIADVLLRLA